MSYTDTTEPAIRAARATLKAAMITFATSTVPPLATPLDNLTQMAHPHLPMCDPDEQALYRALAQYVNNRLIPSHQFAGPPLPLR